MFCPLSDSLDLTLTNQQFVNCAYLEILCLRPYPTGPSLLGQALALTHPRFASPEATVLSRKETPVPRLPVE